MKTTELRENDLVKVTKGLWKGFVGTIEDIHEESSVIRLRSKAGEAAYALKGDVEPV